ncbi:TolC family protein [Bosea sp. (in: a-proteobacteria)]|uniref:TolC family protein n=1 Tax=Bosea sp. (in: a-proteobacteria) TaxID=1871050 RepID=UPI003B3BBCB8
MRLGSAATLWRVTPMLAFALLVTGCVSSQQAPCVDNDGTYPLPNNLCSSYASLDTVPPPPSTAVDAPEMPVGSLPRKVEKPPRAGKLTLQQLVRVLVGTNPDIGIAAAKEKEQFAAIAGAQASLLPSLDLTAAAGPQRNWQTDPAGNALRREVGLSFRQNLYDFGAARSNVERAALAYESATHARIAKSEQTVFDMLDLLLKTQQIDRTIQITKRNIESHESILAIVQSNESNGNSTVADVKRVTTRLESARSTLIDMTTERTNAADAFRRLTDVEVDRVVDHVSPRLGGDPTKLTQERLDQNPEIIAIQNEIASLKQQLEAVRAGALPNLGVESNFKLGRQMSEPDATMDRKSYANVLLSLRVPVLDGGSNDSMRQQVGARLEASYLRLDKRRRELAEDAKGAQRISVSDKDKSGALAARVDAARKVKELYFEQFKDGSRTIFELLDSQVDLVKAETDLIAQDFNRRRARIKTLLLDGTLVRSVMN